jgi:ABC-type branched-subunit amino acid transport system permease subunit
VAGGLWASRTGIVRPSDPLRPASVDVRLMVVLGGPGTLVGGLIGASVVVLLREYLATVVPWWQYVLGAVYVLTILYLPSGIMGLFKGGRA